MGRICLLMALCVSAQETTPTSIFPLLAEAHEKESANAWPAAAATWARITALNPTVGSYWESLGEARLNAGLHREAAAAFTKALELGANSPGNTAYSIAVSHALAGDTGAAFLWLEKALSLRYRHVSMLLDDERLVSLRDDPRLARLAMSFEKGNRDEGWRHDLRFLARELERRHYDPFRKTTKDAVTAAVARLDAQIPKLKDEEVQVGLMRLARMMGDSHTYVRPASAAAIPVDLFLFEEGLYVIGAAPEYAQLVGRRITRIGTNTVERLVAELDSIISQDNPQWVKMVAPELMTYPSVLFGLGLIPQRDHVVLAYIDEDGRTRDVPVPAGNVKSRDGWVSANQRTARHIEHIERNYWFERLPNTATLYMQINVQHDAADESFRNFVRRAFAENFDRLIIDLRWNTGGTRTINHHLVHALIRAEKVNRRGKLYVIVGRHTASAGMCLAAEIERHTNAIFVGEPTGSSPNFVGQDVRIVLPYSRMRGSISDLYWQNSTALDYRIWIAPEIYVPQRFSDFRADRDAAVDTILAYEHHTSWNK